MKKAPRAEAIQMLDFDCMGNGFVQQLSTLCAVLLINAYMEVRSFYLPFHFGI
jgi:hypothetical protein